MENDAASSRQAQIKRRINPAVSVFKSGQEREALEIIIGSKRLNVETIEGAKAILNRDFPVPKPTDALDDALVLKTLDLLFRKMGASEGMPSIQKNLGVFGLTQTPRSFGYIAPLQTGEPFFEVLLRMIEERFSKNSTCYKKAGLSPMQFSRLGSAKKPPEREVVLRFIIALRLSMEEAEELMESAGYTWCPSSKVDMIIKACVEKGFYDPMRVDEELYDHGEETFFSKEEFY